MFFIHLFFYRVDIEWYLPLLYLQETTELRCQEKKKFVYELGYFNSYEYNYNN